MCGPSASENALEGQQQGLSSTLQANYNTQFANQSQVLKNLNNIFTPIAEAGPSQTGFSAAENAALNTQAINSSAAGARNAEQAVANYGAGHGNDSGLISGVQQQIQGAVASQATGGLAAAQNQITQQNYAQGNANYQNATAGLAGVANQYAPNATAGQATGANQTAFGEAKTNADAAAQEFGEIAGGIGALGGVAQQAVGGANDSNFLSGLGGGKIFGSGGLFGGG